MEVDPAAIQAFAAYLADARSQLEQVRARFDQPNATGEHFGRHWKSQGEEYVDSWGMLAPDLANLAAVLDQVAAQLSAGAELNVAGETAAVGDFTAIEAQAGGGD
jgi:hypothetical protein